MPPPDRLVAFGLLGVALALALHSFLGARPPRSDRVTREGGTIFLGESLMHRGYALAEPLIRFCAAHRVSPDALSWLSLLLGAAAGLTLAGRLPGIAALCLALSGLCDLLDGAVARATGRASARGAALDSALDRYVEFFVHAGFLAAFRDRLPLQLITLASLFGGMMVTYTTAKAEALRLAPPRGWMKRPERLVWLALGLTAAALAPLWDISVTALLTAPVALIAVFANLSALRRLHALRLAAATHTHASN